MTTITASNNFCPFTSGTVHFALGVGLCPPFAAGTNATKACRKIAAPAILPPTVAKVTSVQVVRVVVYVPSWLSLTGESFPAFVVRSTTPPEPRSWRPLASFACTVSVVRDLPSAGRVIDAAVIVVLEPEAAAGGGAGGGGGG